MPRQAGPPTTTTPLPLSSPRRNANNAAEHIERSRAKAAQVDGDAREACVEHGTPETPRQVWLEPATDLDAEFVRAAAVEHPHNATAALVSRQRVRQLNVRAMKKLRSLADGEKEDL